MVDFEAIENGGFWENDIYNGLLGGINIGWFIDRR